MRFMHNAASTEAKSSLVTLKRPVRRFDARRSIKMSEQIALEIVREIVDENLKPGDRLPQEAEMVAHYRASRSSVREALRLLEVQGLITIRPGSRTGTAVGEVSGANLGRTLTLYMHMQGVTYHELLEAWVMTEPLLAEQAARNSDRAAVQRALSPFIGATEQPADEAASFHTIISQLAPNRALVLVVHALGVIVAESVMCGREHEKLDGSVYDEHAAIARAIIAGDTALARDLMSAHCRNVVDLFKVRWPHTVGERIPAQP